MRVLIPKTFDAELATLKLDQVADFAGRVGVGPGIVVGRLTHDGHLGWAVANDLRPRVEFTKAAVPA